jgi:hypothetical protein
MDAKLHLKVHIKNNIDFVKPFKACYASHFLKSANTMETFCYHFATIKRLPMFNFPQVWNEEDDRKYNPSLKIYCNLLKRALLHSLAA